MAILMALKGIVLGGRCSCSRGGLGEYLVLEEWRKAVFNAKLPSTLIVKPLFPIPAALIHSIPRLLRTGRPYDCTIPKSWYSHNPTSLFHCPVATLLDLTVESFSRHQIRDVIIVVISFSVAIVSTFLLLHALVTLGEFAKGGETVGTELVEDTGYELGKFLIFAVAVDGEGIGGNGGVDYVNRDKLVAKTR